MITLIVLSMGLLVKETPPAWGIGIVDDLGQKVVLPAPAKRIIALYGAYNEILAAMGLENRIVGRTKADSRPPSILSKPSIGTHMRPNVEIVLGLKPDLAIQSAGRKEALLAVQQIQKEGVAAAVFHPTSFADLFSVIERIGVLTGEPVEAKKLVGSLQSRIDRVKKRIEGISHRPSIFFEVRYPNLLGAGQRSIVNDIIDQAGGINCVEKEKKLVRMNMEALIKRNPGVYVIQRGPMNQNPSNPSSRPHFQVLRAVKNDRIMVVDEQVYSRPGPRSVEAVEELAAFLHPERF
jgi:iron complex transport system substrate-binding protein